MPILRCNWAYICSCRNYRCRRLKSTCGAILSSWIYNCNYLRSTCCIILSQFILINIHTQNAMIWIGRIKTISSSLEFLCINNKLKFAIKCRKVEANIDSFFLEVFRSSHSWNGTAKLRKPVRSTSLQGEATSDKIRRIALIVRCKNKCGVSWLHWGH